MEKLQGIVLKLDNGVTLDSLLPAGEENKTQSIVSRLMETLGKNQTYSQEAAYILVSGTNFGGGEKYRQAVDALKSSSVVAVVAGNFSRAFFRRALNNGVAVIERDITDLVQDGETITIDLAEGRIELAQQKVAFPSYPPFLLSILESGDLIAATKKELGRA